MHQFNPSIFREYDIRGSFGKTLFAEDAYQLGLNYATRVQPGKICVGYDGRLSSPALAKALLAGLTDGGVNVVDLGLVPTPLLYFGVFHLDLDGGIMVTGSHNPPADNGFKIMLGKDALFGNEIRKLAEIRKRKSKRKGKIENIDLSQEYLDKLFSGFRLQASDFRIGFDPGNGATGNIVAEIAKKLNAKIINEKIDGNFPAHHPDPSVEKNLAQLKKLVLDNKLDIGFAFDGDGDRLGIIDNLGNSIAGDQIVAILAAGILKKHPGAPVVVDVKTSAAVVEQIKKLGGKAVMWKTGHSLLKAKMKEINAPLGGEMSAHIFIRDDYYGYDDAIYAAIRFLKVMQKTGKTSAELLDELPKMFATPEWRLEVEESRKFKIVEEVKAALKKDKANYLDIDGVRVNAADGWWLLRASNTGNQLVARAEGKTKTALAALENSLKSYLKLAGVKI